MAEHTLRCRIEDVAEWYPALFLEPYIVACVAAMSRYSASPALFAVDCEGIDSKRLAVPRRLACKCHGRMRPLTKLSGSERPCLPRKSWSSQRSRWRLCWYAGSLDSSSLSSRVAGTKPTTCAPLALRVLEISGTETLVRARTPAS